MSPDTKILIQKLMEGSCTEQELNLLSQELEKENGEIFSFLEKNWESAKKSHHSSVQKKKIWDKLNTEFLKEHKRKKVFKFRKVMRYAVAVALILIGSAVTWQYFQPSAPLNGNRVTFESENGVIKSFSTIEELEKSSELKFIDGKLVLEKPRTESPGKKVAFNTIHIPNGENLVMVLSDSSEVILNAGSSLKYPKYFIAGKDREVYLEGEAFFEITHNPKDAFKVHLSNTTTTVLGTRFNINAFPEAQTEEIVLVDGKVKVTGDGKELSLEPNQMASWNKAKEEISLAEVNSTDHIAWIDGYIIFKNESFKNIIPRLERKYDIEIYTTYEQLLQERFTGKFQNESIEDVLETFKQVKDFKIKKDKNQITINPITLKK